MAKEYEKILFTFYKEDDAEILQAIKEAKEKGISKREFITDLYKRSSASSISAENVERILYAFRLPGQEIRNIMECLTENA